MLSQYILNMNENYDDNENVLTDTRVQDIKIVMRSKLFF